MNKYYTLLEFKKGNNVKYSLFFNILLMKENLYNNKIFENK